MLILTHHGAVSSVISGRGSRSFALLISMSLMRFLPRALAALGRFFLVIESALYVAPGKVLFPEELENSSMGTVVARVFWSDR